MSTTGERAGERDHGAHGGGAMSARLRGLARQTEQIVAAGTYRASDGREVSITTAVEAARVGTRIHGPAPLRIPATAYVDTFFEVTGESSLEAARRLGDVRRY